LKRVYKRSSLTYPLIPWIISP